MADKKKKADKPAETKPVEKPKRRSGKAYGKPKSDGKTGLTMLGSKTIMGIRRDRFLAEIFPKVNGMTPYQVRSMDPTDLNREIESVVKILRERKRERRGHGQYGRYQNYLRGPGRPRSARDAELRRAAVQKAEPTHKTVSDGLKAAAVAATIIGEARKTKSDAEVRLLIDEIVDDGLPISYISNLEI